MSDASIKPVSPVNAVAQPARVNANEQGNNTACAASNSNDTCANNTAAENSFSRILQRQQTAQDKGSSQSQNSADDTAESAQPLDEAAILAAQAAQQADTTIALTPEALAALQAAIAQAQVGISASGAGNNVGPDLGNNGKASDVALPDGLDLLKSGKQVGDGHDKTLMQWLQTQQTGQDKNAAATTTTPTNVTVKDDKATPVKHFQDALQSLGEPAQGKPDSLSASMSLSLSERADVKSATVLSTLSGERTIQSELQLQQAAQQALQQQSAAQTTARANTDLPIHTPPGTRAWAEDVGTQLSWMVNNNLSKAELVLTPPHLGRVEVSITVQGDQTTAYFVSPSTAVRDAIEQALPRLRETMADAGIQLGQAFVGHESSASQGETASRSGRNANAQDAGGVAEVSNAAAAVVPRARLGMVDLFA